MADPAWKCEEKDGEMMCRKGKGNFKKLCLDVGLCFTFLTLPLFSWAHVADGLP